MLLPILFVSFIFIPTKAVDLFVKCDSNLKLKQRWSQELSAITIIHSEGRNIRRDLIYDNSRECTDIYKILEMHRLRKNTIQFRSGPKCVIGTVYNSLSKATPKIQFPLIGCTCNASSTDNSLIERTFLFRRANHPNMRDKIIILEQDAEKEWGPTGIYDTNGTLHVESY